MQNNYHPGVYEISSNSQDSDSNDSDSNDSDPDDSDSKDSATLSLEARLWKTTLHSCLNAIEATGEIAFTKRYHLFVNPGLQITEGCFPIPLPLTVDHAEAIKGVCRQAPFGKGDQTLVDTTVRKTWELDHLQFQLMNPTWKPFLAALVRDATAGLGLQGSVEARPHKLLLYEPGSFFRRHKDSEKEHGMLGTLVVCLPSKHEGGDVCLSFGQKERTFATAPASAFDLTMMAWFSDVSHEVKELTTGYRLVLTYKLVQTGRICQQSAQQFFKQSSRLQSLLREWPNECPETYRLIYQLQHKYTESSISLANMKGRDRAVCETLHDACPASDTFLFFAHMTHRKQDEGYGYGDDYDEPLGTFLDSIYTCDGRKVALNDNIPDKELLGANFSSRSPDSEDEGSFTGNESTPTTYRYHDTVCLLQQDVPGSRANWLTWPAGNSAGAEGCSSPLRNSGRKGIFLFKRGHREPD